MNSTESALVSLYTGVTGVMGFSDSEEGQLLTLRMTYPIFSHISCAIDIRGNAFHSFFEDLGTCLSPRQQRSNFSAARMGGGGGFISPSVCTHISGSLTSSLAAILRCARISPSMIYIYIYISHRWLENNTFYIFLGSLLF